MEHSMIIAKGDGVNIQMAQWDGVGLDVVSVHGLTANCRCWDVIAAAIAPTHRLLAVDLRGRGLSDKPASGYSEKHHRQDLKCALDDLMLKTVVLMGHSLGGYVSMAFAAEYPDQVAGLILIDAGGELSQTHWDRVTAAIKPAIDRLEQTFATVDEYLDLMKQAPFLQPWSAEIEAYFRYDLVEGPKGVRSRINPEHIREEVSAKRETGASQYYSKIKCPVLILRATEGIITPDDILLPNHAVDNMLNSIADARCVDIEATNHYSILFQPNAIRDKEIATFLNRIKH